jgi:hypothetical protein
VSSSAFRVRLALTPVVAAVLAVAATAPAYAHSEVKPAADPPASPTTSVWAIADELARSLARSLADANVRGPLDAAVESGSVDLLTAEPGTAFAGQARKANARVLVAKGLPASSGSVLRVRLADPSMAASLRDGALPLVAATPTDDSAADIAAYAISGGIVTLSAATVPSRPVLMVEVDTAKALQLGLAVMRDTFTARGVAHQVASPSASGAAPAATSGGYWATKIDAVRLSDDEEPWFKGAAEIYSIVGGFDLNGVATVNIVNMPYLDYDGTTYYPNQLLVQYSGYKYNLADVVMMEDDGDTNYEALAEAITDALLTIADQGQYIPLVSPILNAIPSSWWTDDPDYVDSWYTLSTTTSGRVVGASANGWMDLEPYWVSEL